MNNDRDDLEQRYYMLSDEELIRIFSSGNLTELAQSVALSELKLRRLPIPTSTVNDTEFIEIAYLEANMKVFADHLTQIEADLLCGLIQAEGIPADTGNPSFTQTISPFPSTLGHACVRVPIEYVMQAMIVMNAYNNGSFQLDEALMPRETDTEALIGETYISTKAYMEEDGEKLLHNKLIPEDATSIEPSYKTTESNWSGIIMLVILLLILTLAYQEWFTKSFFK